MATRKKTSTFAINEKRVIECDLTYAISRIDGRWKPQLLTMLVAGKLRFSELKKEFSFITERMLALQLRALEQDGLVKRTVYTEVPVRVEYEITDVALDLQPIFEQLSGWGRKHRKVVVPNGL
jgi:DNA-binding HxlR family transcriptional regulator